MRAPLRCIRTISEIGRNWICAMCDLSYWNGPSEDAVNRVTRVQNSSYSE